MAGFDSFRQFADADTAGGRVRQFTWRKAPTQATGQGVWFDLSMSPGNPVPQYYAAAPLAAVAMSQTANGGIFHGGAVSPDKKFLRTAMALTPSNIAPMQMVLCDYLLYYPFIDEGTTDEQPLTNAVPLPRYASGAGVQVVAVVVGGQTGGQQFLFTYTNSDGVSGRVSPPVTMGTQAVTGTVLTSALAVNGACAPLLPLQAGDSGVRSIESVTCLGADVGLFTLVLVKPLARLSIRGTDAPVEVDYLTASAHLPEVKDDAYLNYLCCANASLASSQIHGLHTYTWG